MTTGKTIPLIIQTFVGKVMSLLLNTLSRFVIAFQGYKNRITLKVVGVGWARTLEPGHLLFY